MHTPIQPTECDTTGRLMTEWFEYPELTLDQLKELARRETGVENPVEGKALHLMTPEERADFNKYHSFINKIKTRRWPGHMSKQEAAARLNEASKMVDPSNFKFLDQGAA